MLTMKFSVLAILFFAVQGFALAQPRTITGTVTAQSGETLIGVSVQVQGTTIGSITNADGTYSINVPGDAETLVFSFVGMETQEIQTGEPDHD